MLKGEKFDAFTLHGNGSTCFYFNDMKGGCKKCERTK